MGLIISLPKLRDLRSRFGKFQERFSVNFLDRGPRVVKRQKSFKYLAHRETHTATS